MRAKARRSLLCVFSLPEAEKIAGLINGDCIPSGLLILWRSERRSFSNRVWSTAASVFCGCFNDLPGEELIENHSVSWWKQCPTLNILVTLLKADVSEKSAQCSHPTAELGKLQWIGRLYNRRKSNYDSLILTKALHFVWQAQDLDADIWGARLGSQRMPSKV
jgi:hypothetical protein